MVEGDLAAVVRKTKAEAIIASLRTEDIYDDTRSVTDHGEECVAIPITRAPNRTTVLEVVQDATEPRLRTLEDHLLARGWSEDDIEMAPGSWAVIGSVVLVDIGEAPDPKEVGEALLALHGAADTVLARGSVTGAHRKPTVEVIAGEGDTETVHVEHGTTYAMDLAEVMFSPGNKAERARMGKLANPDEHVLDMFAGIGYFSLPMARAGARVTAVERNPVAFKYLLENTVRNDVTDRLAAYRGDNRDVVPELDGHFDRVVLGFYDAFEYLDVALPAIDPGGILHMHEATPDPVIPERPVERLEEAAEHTNRSAVVDDIRIIKGYSEGVDHVVVDATVT